MNTVFSEHSSKRIFTRLSMSKSELADILEQDKTIDVAIEQGSTRVHRLFFSTYDQLCFLAIQDRKTGTVITVVPVNNYGMGRNVSLEAQMAAQQIINGEQAESKKDWLVKLGSGQKTITKLKFTGYVVDKRKNVRVVNFSTEVHIRRNFKIADLSNDSSFIENFQKSLQEVISRKKYSISEIQTLYIRTGKKKEPVLIDDCILWKLLATKEYSCFVH